MPVRRAWRSDANVVGVKAKRVQCDEIWSFTYAKQKNVAKAKAAPEGAGDTWTWTALDSDSKLLISWLVGRRDAYHAQILMDDVKARINGRTQITTDGLRAYVEAIEGAFGSDVDFAQLIKLYGEPATTSPERKYSPSERRTCEPDHAYAHAPVYSPHEWLFKEA
jgi:IS1 family transposase